jgi:hypothetical protein
MKEQTVILSLLMLSILAIPVFSVSASTDTLTITGNFDTANMALKATKEGGKTSTVGDFQLTADNVLQIEPGDTVTITNDVVFSKARTFDANNVEKRIPVSVSGEISFVGYAQGSYILDVIVDNNKAYECIIVVGEEDQETVVKTINKSNSQTFTDIWVITIFEFPPPPPTDEPTPPITPPVTPPPTDQPIVTPPPTDTPTDQPGPPSCTTPDGRPGQIGSGEGGPTCTPIDQPSLGAPAGRAPGSVDPSDDDLCKTPNGQTGRLTGGTCVPGDTGILPATPLDQPAPDECFGFLGPTGDLPTDSDCANAPIGDSPLDDIIDCEAHPELCPGSEETQLDPNVLLNPDLDKLEEDEDAKDDEGGESEGGSNEGGETEGGESEGGSNEGGETEGGESEVGEGGESGGDHEQGGD